MRKRKHFWKQIILVIVLQVIDGIEVLEVIRAELLDLIENLLIIQITTPKQAVVVQLAIILGWSIIGWRSDTIVAIV